MKKLRHWSQKKLFDRQSDKQQAKAGTKKRPDHKRAWKIVGTIALVFVLTVAVFIGIFMTYIDKTMRGKVEVYMSEYDTKRSTELYYQDPDSGEWIMYQTLFLNSENRIPATLDEIPKALQDAAIAIEDKRFMTHKGVDWHGTLRAIFSTLTSDSTQGGSTITQQLIKNLTDDNQVTVKRKITEIYRALQLEKEYDKDVILEAYLNNIYLGNSCYGVQTASQKYFGKDVSELTLAECASLISITNNPSMYDPLRSDWCRENNRERQLTVLEAMLDQEKISKEEYDAAANEEIVFTDGYTCLGNYKEDHLEEGENTDSESTAWNSYFTDQVIEDVAKALIEKYDIQDDPADENGEVYTAYKKAIDRVYGFGYKIYTTQNMKYQEICEDVMENTKFADYTDSNDQPLQAAVTLIDPFTGDVLAMVGGTGAKMQDRGWNWATETRQCGSAIKPISTYAPALDDGTITAASVIDDYPVRELNGAAWPRNSHSGFDGLVSVQTAVIQSLNTCAVRVNELYGTDSSYTFMVNKLGFTTLTDTDSVQSGNMALGGLAYGVTTEQMAAAYGAFVNDGIYTKPRTFVKVEDANGNVILENKSESHVAMKETTAYLMRNMLESVISSGTGGEAYFSGMSIGGKTGTTEDNRDRYFVGFSPYYCAAVWTGYESNEELSYAVGNASASLWKSIMKRVHKDLSDPGFHDCDSGLTKVTVCADSGLLATDACKKDLRGSRVRTVTVAADTAPTESCNVHKVVSYCTEGKHVATENCPKDKVKEVALLDWNRTILGKIKADDHQYLLSVASEGDICPKHKTALPILPILPVEPTDPTDPDDPPGGEEEPPDEGNQGVTDILNKIINRQ